MRRRRFLEADHQRTQFRQRQPKRYRATQHAAFGTLRRGGALAGDDEDERFSARLRAVEERRELFLRLALFHPVQVDPRADLDLTASDFLPCPAIDGRKRRQDGR